MRLFHHIFSVLVCFTLLGISSQAKAQDEGIHFFHGSWAEVKAEAKAKNLPIFIDCYTTWCGPCKHMASTVFTRSAVGDFYNKNFVCYKLDMEHGDGPEVAKTYAVHFYPTYIFLNPNIELMHKAMGQKESEEFIQDGRNALDPEKAIYGMIKKFKNGQKDTVFLRALLLKVHELEPEVEKEVLKEFWLQIPESTLIEERNWGIFHDLDFDIHSRAYIYILAHKAEFIQRYGKEDVLNNLYGKAVQLMQQAGKANDEKAFMDARQVLASSDEVQARQVADYALAMFYGQNKKWKQYADAASEFLKKYGDEKAEMYTRITTEAMNLTDDKIVMGEARHWMEKAVKLDKGAKTVLLYAKVLYKLDKLKDAEKEANAAREIANTAHQSTTDIDELLAQIKAKQKK